MPLPHDTADLKLRDNLRALDAGQQRLTAATAAYTPTNVSTDRAFDANATTTAELADVLGTLIADLQSKQIIS